MKNTLFLVLSILLLKTGNAFYAENPNPTIFPNPAKDFVNVSVKKIQKIDVAIYTLLGSKVKFVSEVNSTLKIDITDLKSGVYILQVNTLEATKSIRLRVL